MKLTGRGKQTYWCEGCNQIKPIKGRKHIHGKAVCADCAKQQLP